jgi:hypothetical protein
MTSPVTIEPIALGLLPPEVYAYRGETNQAFEWLDRAYAARDVDIMIVLSEPFASDGLPGSRRSSSHKAQILKHRRAEQLL